MASPKQPSRKRRQPKAGSLSREHPTSEELESLVDAMTKGPAVSTAILGAAFVEYYLEAAIRRRMPRNDDVVWKELIGEKGPLGTLSMKILLGHALRIYGDDLRDNLDIMRTVRNVFAHAKKLVEFDNEKIVGELRAVTGKRQRFGKYKTLTVADGPREARSAYLQLCLHLAMELMLTDVRANNQKRRRHERKMRPKSGSDYLAKFLGIRNPTPRQRLAGALIVSGAIQNENPKHEAPGSASAEALDLPRKKTGNEDKSD